MLEHMTFIFLIKARYFFQVGISILLFSIRSLQHCMCQQNDRSHLWVSSAVSKVWARASVQHRRACAGPWPFAGLTSVYVHSFGHQGHIGQHVENGFWLFLVFVYSKFCLLRFESIRSVKRNWEIRHTKHRQKPYLVALASNNVTGSDRKPRS